MLPFGMEAERPDHAEPVGQHTGWPHRGWQELAGDLQDGLMGAGLACPTQRGNCTVPLAEPVPACGHGRAGAVTAWHVRQVQGCWLPQRLLVPGEAALGSVSALAGGSHRSDDIKMLVLMWQRQPWDINRRCFAGKKENDNTLHQNYYSAVP